LKALLLLRSRGLNSPRFIILFIFITTIHNLPVIFMPQNPKSLAIAGLQYMEQFTITIPRDGDFSMKKTRGIRVPSLYMLFHYSSISIIMNINYLLHHHA